MIHTSDVEGQRLPTTREPRDWVRVLSAYREPSLRRSIYELAVTIVPFVLLWGLALSLIHI